MDTTELKEAWLLLDEAIALSKENDTIQLSRFPGADWYITWNEGTSDIKIKLTSEQKQLMHNTLIERLERFQKDAENRLIKYLT